MAGRDVAAAASSLLAPLFDGPVREVRAASVTATAWHLTTSEPMCPLVSLQRSRSIVLPCSVVYDGDISLGAGDTTLIGAGTLTVGPAALRPTRWWAAPRPVIRDPHRFLDGLARLPVVRPGDVDLDTVDLARPETLIGWGPGLTPAGDDVLAGSLVLLNALGHDPRPQWCDPVTLAVRTSALSAALLHHARHGYCLDALAALISALDRGRDAAAALGSLLEVGGTSGRAMLLGMQLTAASGSGLTARREGAA